MYDKKFFRHSVNGDITLQPEVARALECMQGKHECEEEPRRMSIRADITRKLADGKTRFSDGCWVHLLVCKHCRCLYVEES